MEANGTVVRVTNLTLVAGCRAINNYSIHGQSYVCEVTADGMNTEGFNIIIKKPIRCLLTSALAHELLHTIEKVWTESYSLNHTIPYMFKQNYTTIENKRDTAEYKIYNELFSRADKYQECE